MDLTNSVSVTGTLATANGKTATCTVKVEKAAEAQNFTVPKLNYEYGPFTAECHFSTGNYWYTTQVDSLVFTKCEMTNIGKYKIAVSIQGTSDFDTTGIIANFYDSNNRVLDEVRLTARVPGNNQPFNVLDETYVERETIENAVRIEFYDVTAADVLAACREKGLLVLTAKTRLRLLPPLTLTAHDVDMALEVLAEVLGAMEPTAPKEQA